MENRNSKAKVVSKDELSKEIANEVVRKLTPVFKKLMTEQAKLILKNNKRIVREQINSCLAEKELDLDERKLSSYIFEDKKNGQLQLVEGDDKRKESIESGKLKAKSMLDGIYSDPSDPQSVDDLINSAQVQDNIVEGGDMTFKPQELKSVTEVDDELKEVNPANVDYSAFMDKLEN
ncbi:MAG: hypothetical protein CMB80_02035 [Flammeovirgaceae bacterium]|nr:hypothetical protein [Flammeovirgaceae bacterium]|tara:strand:+ start:431 stop:961 length:531 start_codon:yes stop_codon:yes gene_type:complete